MSEVAYYSHQEVLELNDTFDYVNPDMRVQRLDKIFLHSVRKESRMMTGDCYLFHWR